MKKQLIIGVTMALFTVSLVLAGFAIAIESDYLLDQEVIITGVVEQEGDAFILQAIDGDQYTMTGQDLSQIVGKKVQATGELIREKNENRFNVSEVVEISDEEMALDKEPDAQVPLE